MKIFRKERCTNGRRHIYFCGIKIMSYKKRGQELDVKYLDKQISRLKTMGVHRPKRKQKIIVSLTSFPARINMVHYTIFSLLKQTVKPDKIILWLAHEQFCNKEDDLPKKLLNLCNYGLTIKWCNDIKSYKKLVPALKEYPDDIIITVDDDVYYRKNTIKKLVAEYKKHPNDIICHRITKIIYENSKFRTVVGGKDYWHGASYLNKLTGVGAVLYPPHCLHSDIFNEDLFMKLAPTNDDLWFWCMGVINGVKTRVVQKPEYTINSIPETQEFGLCNINSKNGSELFWNQFNNLVTYYPEFKQKLINEHKERVVKGI